MLIPARIAVANATAGRGPEKIGAKIPYLLIVGEQEAAAGTVAVRPRAGAEEKMSVAAFTERAKAEAGERLAGPATAEVSPD